MTEICLYCEEAIGKWDPTVPVGTEEGRRLTHRECSLREVTGGIGHLIAHEYWCGAPRHDPDAGLTRRQSSLLVARWFEVVGPDAVDRAVWVQDEPEPEPEGTLAAQLQEMYPENWQAASDDDEEWATAVVQWAESPEPPEEDPPGRRGPVPGSGAVWGPPRQL
jgi:hypothetical protein